MGQAASTTDYRTRAEAIRSKWGWFLLLGVVLIAGGTAAVLLPAISTLAASLVLGVVLAITGVVKIIEALQVKQWTGFVWQLLVGAIEVVGGILIYLHPMKGALAISLLIAVVFVVQGIAQTALALKLRPQAGWGWLLASGLLALLVFIALLLKVRYTGFYTPGTIAGIALLIGGCAYVAIALAVRNVRA